MKTLDKLRVAIVYDWFDKWGGVERVLLTLSEMFPRAQFFTSYYDPEAASWAKNLKIKTSFIQKLPSFIKKSRILSLPLYPYAFESFNFNDFDLVISVSSSFAKSVITKPETLHISYLLTPTRYFWIDPQVYLDTAFRKLGYLRLKQLKKWDFVAARRPDYILSISKAVANRCKKYYKRSSEVIYPPFDLEYWQKVKAKVQNSKLKSNPKFEMLDTKFYLVVSRLEPYKKVGLALETFNELDKPLVIVGKGSQLAQLKREAGENIEFFFDLSDEELGMLYQNARALIMPQVEEFGYVAVEAQFFGCPIIAYGRGGALETTIENKTVIFFEQQTKLALSAAIERFESVEYNLKSHLTKLGAENVVRFDRKIFEESFKQFIIDKLKDLEN